VAHRVATATAVSEAMMRFPVLFMAISTMRTVYALVTVSTAYLNLR
jgi:hypothetical protein